MYRLAGVNTPLFVFGRRGPRPGWAYARVSHWPRRPKTKRESERARGYTQATPPGFVPPDPQQPPKCVKGAAGTGALRYEVSRRAQGRLATIAETYRAHAAALCKRES
jgi:hypothetical protein